MMSCSDWSSDFTEDEEDCDFSIIEGRQTWKTSSRSRSLPLQLEAESTQKERMDYDKGKEKGEYSLGKGLASADDTGATLSPCVKRPVDVDDGQSTSFCQHCGVTFPKKSALQFHLENFICQPHLWLREDDSENDSDDQTKVEGTKDERNGAEDNQSVQKCTRSYLQTTAPVVEEKTDKEFSMYCSSGKSILPVSNTRDDLNGEFTCKHCEITFAHKNAYDHHVNYFICRPNLWLKEEYDASSSDESRDHEFVAKRRNIGIETERDKDDTSAGDRATLLSTTKRKKLWQSDLGAQLVCDHCRFSFLNRFAFKNHVTTYACWNPEKKYQEHRPTEQLIKRERRVSKTRSRQN